MSERVVSIKLQADATGLVQGFNRASDAAQELREKATSTGQKLAQSARENRAAWTTVGAGLTAVGVAVTGIGVAALKTGIQYNTLQQTTRAALTTLLGSAQAANAQMDKLDAFARNSPFSKATFITAQQQMLAFGIETKKVIPYLDAVQNAVAAAGGSNQQIAEIAFIMAQISSAGKITGQDLMQFGQRGVNAAELIGSQMGKTGAEIRSEITAGTLDANRALDALAAGMAEKYEGAAANVKNTFAGAMDRVKAAWRDFSAELAKPLVDPNGGGALVDLLNWTADAMRNFEGLSDSSKNAITGLVGVTGAAALLVGTSMLVIPKVVEFVDALKTMGVTATSTKGMLAAVVPAAIALAAVPIAAGAARWVDGLREVTVEAGALQNQLKKTGDTAGQLERGLTGGSAFRGLGMDASIAEGNLRQLNTGIGQLKAKFDNSALGAAMSVPFLGLGREAGNAQKQIDELDSALAGLVQGGRSSEAAAGFAEFASAARDAGWSTEEINDALPQYVAAQEEAERSSSKAADAAREVASGYTEQASAAQEATNVLFELIDAMNEANDAGQKAESVNARYQQSVADVAKHIESVHAGVEGYSASLDENTVEGAKNRAMLAGLAADSQAAARALYDQELRTLGAEQATANYNDRLSAGRQGLYDTIIALTGNADAAQLLTDKIYAIPPGRDIKIAADTAAATQQIDNFIGRLNSIPSPVDVHIRTFESLVYSQDGLDAKYKRASGGTVGYATGGTVGLAAGGTVRGIGGGIASGTVYGRGTETSDSVLVRLSRGEEVIRASQAAKYRPMLKAVNDGTYRSSDFRPSDMSLRAPVVSTQVAQEVTQNNSIVMNDRDPRLVIRQLNREFKGML